MLGKYLGMPHFSHHAEWVVSCLNKLGYAKIGGDFGVQGVAGARAAGPGFGSELADV